MVTDARKKLEGLYEEYSRLAELESDARDRVILGLRRGDVEATKVAREEVHNYETAKFELQQDFVQARLELESMRHSPEQLVRLYEVWATARSFAHIAAMRMTSDSCRVAQNFANELMYMAGAIDHSRGINSAGELFEVTQELEGWIEDPEEMQAAIDAPAFGAGPSYDTIDAAALRLRSMVSAS